MVQKATPAPQKKYKAQSQARTAEDDEFEMVGGKGKRLNAFTKASLDDYDSDSSEDYRVPKMLYVGIQSKNIA